jgi:GNAT superfamily N-acetyltransferase
MIHIYLPDSTHRAADIALKNRLYVSGWQLSYILKDIRSGHQHQIGSKVAIYYEDKEPVGVAVITKYCSVQVFVRQSERRKGIGSALVKALSGGQRCYAQQGIHGSEQFWYKNGCYYV